MPKIYLKFRLLIKLFKILSYKNRAAFTLVEISVVILVIGLILGLIIKGDTVIESARIRTVISEIGNYKIAIESFKMRYNSLPGDFAEATIYWNSNNIINGNNDGKISFQNKDGVFEGYNAWQHLSNEHMIDEDFLGKASTGKAEFEKDIPKARIGGGYFLTSGLFADLPNANIVALGAPGAAIRNGDSYELGFTSSLTPNQAHEIDNKIDDSIPSTGNVRALSDNLNNANNPNNPNNILCSNKNNYYNLEITDIACKLLIGL